MTATLNQLNSAWEIVCSSFTFNSAFVGKENVYRKEERCINEAINLLCSNGLANMIVDWFIEEYRKDLNEHIVPQFWDHFQMKHEDDEAFENFCMAVDKLYQRVVWFKQPALQVEEICSCSETPEQSVVDTIARLPRVLLRMGMPVHFHSQVIQYCSRAFKAYHARNSDIREGFEAELMCSGCDKDTENCTCQKTFTTFTTVNQNLSELGLLEALVGDAILTSARHQIEEFVQENCKGNFESYMTPLQDWLEKTVFGWLDAAFCSSNTPSEQTGKSIKSYRELLSYYLIETYALVRMDQLFNIIIEFPDSHSALEDLRECLEKTNLRAKLITSLKKSLETRLLHPGVSTEDVLTAYISAIKALRVLDPTGVILQLSSQPVCKYLRSRSDTVRCIVTILTDDSNSELMMELLRGAPLVLDDHLGCHSDDEDDVSVTGDWENWQPDPIDADPSKAPKSHRSSDIISILVNIYGTRELFVKEYQALLADRILASFCYDTEREIRYLELLKLRFGESYLHLCEVMVKDVTDSKRINSNINNAEAVAKRAPEDFPLDAMIISAQFWPSLKEERVELPACVKAAFERYTKSFEALKGNRTLIWKPSIGLVRLEIELKDRTLDLQVVPIQAAIIWQFQEKATWSIDELSQALGSPTSVIRRKITFWQSHGVLREEQNEVFTLIEERAAGCGMVEETPMEEEDDGEVVAASSEEQKEEELQMYWSFIVGMLTNLDSLPLEQIHNMLRMFAMQGHNATDFTPHQLRQFLNQKVAEEKLVFSAGLYKLVPSQ